MKLKSKCISCIMCEWRPVKLLLPVFNYIIYDFEVNIKIKVITFLDDAIHHLNRKRNRWLLSYYMCGAYLETSNERILLKRCRILTLMMNIILKIFFDAPYVCLLNMFFSKL